MRLGIGLNITRQNEVFRLSNLFSRSEPGFTFEPWDMTTLYQDRAGTTPVTAVGQSVGLRLSKDQGLRIGPELVTNGDFASGAIGWTLGTDWSISGGFASRGANVTASNLTGGSGVEAGKTYRVTWTQGAEAVAVYLGSAAGPLVSNTSAAGTYSRLVLATVTGGIVFRASASVSSIDNISVRELAGNHEVAINDAARGVYGREPENGTRNRLTYTEQFDNAVWIKSNATVTANTIIAPDGTTTADKLTETTATNEHIANYALASITSTVYTGTIYIKASERTFTRLSFANLANGSVWFNLSTGLVGTKQSAVTTATIVNMGNGWYRCSATWAANGVSNYFTVGVASADNVATYTGDGTSGVYIWGAQLELGATATAYQAVVSQYDVTEAGVASCYYVQTDGVDDAYVTPTITPGTDKVQVFAGVRKNSDLGSSAVTIIESSVRSDTTDGSFMLFARDTFTPAMYEFGSRGTIFRLAGTNNASFAAPITNVLTGIGDISGDTATLRVNGTQVAQATTDQGTGNYLAYPAYIYARAGTSFPFNGRDYGHAVRFGPNLDAATIARVEALIARNTPTVTL